MVRREGTGRRLLFGLSGLLWCGVVSAAPPAPSSRSASTEAVSYLEKTAEQSVIAGQLPRAVTLLRGLAALKPEDPSPIYRLAEVYTLAGQYEEAIAEYRRFRDHRAADPARKGRAESEAKRLEEAPAPFAESVFKMVPATAEAKRLFDQGKKSAQEKRYQSAVSELEAAMLLDPDLPGPYRLLGAVYGKTGAKAEERKFLAEYLRVRPDGKIADTVRQQLKNDNVLGSITVDASFPCRVTINGRDVGKTTPLKKFLVPAGKYVVGLENEKYHIVRLLRVDVTAGKESEKKFNFGVLSTKLDPWARVRVDGKDVGLWDEAGIPEGKHTIYYKSHDGKLEKSVQLEIKGGTRTKLTW